jgi:SAM-dependent methyltransferase
MSDSKKKKTFWQKIPLLGGIFKSKKPHPAAEFPGSATYWEQRYCKGGNSGAGSYNRLALFKAEVLNRFAQENNVQSVIEFGCGDGNQLKLAKYHQYLGIDVASKAVELCRKDFADDSTKTFETLEKYSGQKADLSLSLDVIYHLIEDEVFNSYMQQLFDAGNKYVIVYASNDPNIKKKQSSAHVKHRKFSSWVETNRPDWKLKEFIPNRYPQSEEDQDNTSFADFYIYQKA